ncbi:MAG: ImmA/IrrE family metallo-endopeptidase [Armatimonadota bacterium]
MVNDLLEEQSARIWKQLGLIIPCDVGAVCSHYNIDLIRRPLGDEVSAFYLTLPSGRTEIVVNSLDSPRRRQFSIAHELGHHIIGSARPQMRLLMREAGADGDAEERYASQFAACLLMPEPLVVEMYNFLEDDPDWRLSVLSDKFYVSRPAMLIRLKQLGLPVVNQWYVTEITLQSVAESTASENRLNRLLIPRKHS